MGTILINPKNVPTSVEDDWTTLVNVNAAGNVGYNAITLTNWDASTLAPAVAAGSMIEINGSICYFAAEEAIGNIATGVNYLRFTVSGSTVTPVWSLTGPTWSAGHNAWMDGGIRYSGHRVTLEGGAYYLKNKMVSGPNGYIAIPEYCDPVGKYGYIKISVDNQQVYFPDGGYTIAMVSRMRYQVFYNGAWRDNTIGVPSDISVSGLYIFTANHRLLSTGLSSEIHYFRLW